MADEPSEYSPQASASEHPNYERVGAPPPKTPRPAQKPRSRLDKLIQDTAAGGIGLTLIASFCGTIFRSLWWGCVGCCGFTLFVIWWRKRLIWPAWKIYAVSALIWVPTIAGFNGWISWEAKRDWLAGKPDRDFKQRVDGALTKLTIRADAQDQKIDALQPRRLTQQQMDMISSYLIAGKFTGRYALSTARFAGDARQYAQDFHDTLTKAGWTQVESPAFLSPFNFEIRINPDINNDKTMPPQFKALLMVLYQQKVIAFDTPLTPDANIPPDTVIFWIGLHP